MSGLMLSLVGLWVSVNSGHPGAVAISTVLAILTGWFVFVKKSGPRW
jgi:hypothetical protein